MPRLQRYVTHELHRIFLNRILGGVALFIGQFSVTSYFSHLAMDQIETV